MPVTRTNRSCPYCGYVGIEEFAGLCASCAAEHREQVQLSKRLWCRFCGGSRLFEYAEQMRCMDRDCRDVDVQIAQEALSIPV
jgi:hypothetical protein